jgi:hypothetical protein
MMEHYCGPLSARLAAEKDLLFLSMQEPGTYSPYSLFWKKDFLSIWIRPLIKSSGLREKYLANLSMCYFPVPILVVIR